MTDIGWERVLAFAASDAEVCGLPAPKTHDEVCMTFAFAEVFQRTAFRLEGTIPAESVRRVLDVLRSEMVAAYSVMREGDA